jgi:predicted dehydrogenase
MTSSVMKVGILGAGGVVEASHLPVLSQMPGVRVEWLCDLDLGRAAKLARGWTVPHARDNLKDCPDVDAVLIAIPVGRRREALASVFGRRWHAFVEKPFAVSAEEHLRIVREAANAGIEVGVGLMRRFFRSTAVARLALAREVFGPVREVWASEASRMGTTGREGSWYQADPSAAGGGVLIETGSHLVDQVFHVLGVESYEGLRATFTKIDGIDIEIRAIAELHRAGGAEPVPLRLLISRARDFHTGVVVRCEHASLRFGVGPDSAVEVLGRDDRPLCRLERAPGATNLFQAFFQEWQAFLEQCRARTPSLVDARSALLSTRFIESAYEIGAGRQK